MSELFEAGRAAARIGRHEAPWVPDTTPGYQGQHRAETEGMATIEVFYTACGDVFWARFGTLKPEQVRCVEHDSRLAWYERRNVWKP